MSENESRPQQPKIYEDMYPEVRFKELTDTIIEKFGEQSDNGQLAVYAKWPEKPEGYHYISRRWISMDPENGLPIATHTLEHYIDELPEDKPLIRYAVKQSVTGQISVLSVLDERFVARKMDDEAKREAAREALGILSLGAPDDAAELLRSAFDHDFNELVGSYVLSGLALEGMGGEMNDTDALRAALNFADRTNTIKSEEVKRAKKVQPTAEFPHRVQPAYAEFVAEAASEGRTQTNKNGYSAVDPLAAAAHVARIVGKWPNLIPVIKKSKNDEAA